MGVQSLRADRARNDQEGRDNAHAETPDACGPHDDGDDDAIFL